MGSLRSTLGRNRTWVVLAGAAALAWRAVAWVYRVVSWLFAACLSLMLGWFLVLVARDALRVRDFDPAAWRAATDQDRAYMADDLIAHHVLGRSRPELTTLLGDSLPRLGDPPEEAWWWVGLERGPMRLDTKCVWVTFGAEGRATAATLRDC